jgi:hypothetical protein
MKPINFKEANKNLLKPESMTDEECGPLSIYTEGSYCISCWRPTFRERLSILLFGKVWLWVMGGKTQPPVSVEGKRTIFRMPK